MSMETLSWRTVPKPSPGKLARACVYTVKDLGAGKTLKTLNVAGRFVKHIAGPKRELWMVLRK